MPEMVPWANPINYPPPKYAYGEEALQYDLGGNPFNPHLHNGNPWFNPIEPNTTIDYPELKVAT